MCGILALLHPGRHIDQLVVDGMLSSLSHRGPDDRGVWTDRERGVTLGQTRLAIQDTSLAGHQPMVSASGRFVIVFNGEIYNHRDLRCSLRDGLEDGLGEKISWRGHSDTETVLAHIEQRGIERTLQELVGMFAISLWDREQQLLYLIRDRIGEKPLYYGYSGTSFVVASELRAFRMGPGFDDSIDREALGLMMRYAAVPAPHSIYRFVRKLEPGCLAVIRLSDVRRRAMPAVEKYWSAASLASRLGERPLAFDDDASATDALQACLGRAVARQLISDVPLGAFLSGGVDSSIIVAMMQEEARKAGGDAVKTFCIGFEDSRFDEAGFAREVAAHLGTQHVDLYVNDAECEHAVHRLSEVYDEPFADPSQIGVCLVSRLARQHVTVALSGDGGDEVFGGYNRYTRAARWWRLMERIPATLRRGAGRCVASIPSGFADRAARRLSFLSPRFANSLPGLRLDKMASMLLSQDSRSMYMGLVENWRSDDVVNGTLPGSILDRAWPDMPSLEERMMLLDLMFILPTDMLVKVDRAAMNVGLETRAPFLDRDLLEFSWRLPLRYKCRDGQGKWLLRKLLHRYVPPRLVDRPKMGFQMPIGRWLAGPLREWAETLLAEATLREAGYFNVGEVRRHWVEHLAGRNDHSSRLWSVLMFEAWRQRQRGAMQEAPRSSGRLSIHAV